MATEYDIDQIRRLEDQLEELNLHYRHAPIRHDPGAVLDIEITGVCPAVSGHAVLDIERYVGAGFAGQVYKTRLRELDLAAGSIPGLAAGRVYAVKINVPDSGFARRFRNAVYWLGFQSAFSYQVNRAAARAGVLWQKLIRRGAALRFDDDNAVADTYATFFDGELGAYGEINEWVEGRNWRFEIDDEVFGRGKLDAELAHGSREYLAKKEFMAGLVHLLHDMGAGELARQYTWWTCKSQPNVVKRIDAPDGPADGLTALDFRAGLVLMPFLPMSPADFALILRGIRHGRFVQFDRGDIETIETFCEAHPEEFNDLWPALDELKQTEPIYRRSQPDITHHHFHLLTDHTLRRDVKTGLIEGWHVRGFIDDTRIEPLINSFWLFWLFWLTGAIPILGKRFRRMWGVASYARHVKACITDFGYLRRSFRGRQIETLAEWYRDGRVDATQLERLLARPFLFWRLKFATTILPVPAKWQRFLTDWGYAWRSTVDLVKYPVRFYREARFREDWLANEIEEGASAGMLTDQEKRQILARVSDPFIQKYLKCVAVHLCTLPITQVISVVMAVWAYFYFGKSWQEGLLWAGAVLAAFQGAPISPGSIVRGTYVVYLMIKERNFKNYWLAVLVSYWHYVGYLGFPLQMVREFPSLARFVAGRWATRMVGFIPVFGERGALLEHLVFDMFFNVPLSLKRRWSRPADELEPGQ